MKKRVFCCLLTIVMLVALMPTALAAGNTVDFNGHRYERIDQSMTWAEAKAYCETRGGHLATITSPEEQNAVESVLQGGNKNNYWLGAYRTQENTFAWVTGEDFNQYTHWDQGEPNNYINKGENSVHIFRVSEPFKGHSQVGYWNDVPDEGEQDFFALEKFGLVCEYDYIASNWAQTELQKADDLGLIPDALKNADLTRPITRSEFAAVSVKTYEKISGTQALPATNSPFTDCNDLEVLKAYNLGVTNGISPTTFGPNTLLDREQAATMLTRVFKRATMPGWTLSADAAFPLTYQKPTPFADDADISNWAKDSVYFMAANGIIGGVGNNKFAPKNVTPTDEANQYANATREQALAIAVRMVDHLK